MQKIIKKIRTYMNISQKEFAEKIGVTASTVNRWEKGAAPTENMAEGIYSLCVKNNIPAYDMIIDEIKAAADSIVLEENRKSGVNFANRICRDYRREGRFFDEILDDAL